MIINIMVQQDTGKHCFYEDTPLITPVEGKTSSPDEVGGNMHCDYLHLGDQVQLYKAVMGKKNFMQYGGLRGI